MALQLHYNYHTHTYRCHHAVGADREYVERAIQGGITDMGFSDHMPFVFPDGFSSDYRISFSQAADYIDSVKALAAQYRDRLTLRVGFEMEYYPLYFDRMLSYARDIGAEYLILGQHFIDNEHPSGFYAAIPHTDERILKTYVDEVIEALSTDVFSYLAHPDLCNFQGDDAVYDHHMRRLCQAAKATNTPLEINLLGIRSGRNYPCDRFFRIAGEEGCLIVLGCDAHDPQSAFDEASLKDAQRLIDTHHLTVIDHPRLKLI